MAAPTVYCCLSRYSRILCRVASQGTRPFSSSSSSSSSSSASSKVPVKPTWSSIKDEDLPPSVQVDRPMIDHLERLALVDFGNEEGIVRLNKAVRFADQMALVDTADVEPMTSVLEDRAVYLRQDKVTVGDCRSDLLKLAKKTVEEYYVSPPGNIPLEKHKEETPRLVAIKKQS